MKTFLRGLCLLSITAFLVLSATFLGAARADAESRGRLNKQPFAPSAKTGIPCVPGDMNGDGCVTVEDLALFQQAVLSGEYNECADMNGDGLVDGNDIQGFIIVLLAPLPPGCI